MPPTSSIRTFIDALKTGQTRTTRKLDDLFATPGQLNLTFQQDQDLRTPNIFSPQLPDWVRNLLSGPHVVTNPLSKDELQHIDEWPSEQKEEVRKKLVTARDNNLGVRFFWELYEGTAPATVISDLGGSLGFLVTFSSPRSQLTLSDDDATISVPVES